MKKYTKPMVEVVELTVKESLSALPDRLKIRNGFNFSMGRVGAGNKNVSVYTAGNSSAGNQNA